MFIPDPKSGRLPIAYTPSYVVEVGLEPTLKSLSLIQSQVACQLADSTISRIILLYSLKSTFTAKQLLCAVYEGIEPSPPDRQSGILAFGPIDLLSSRQESNLLTDASNAPVLITLVTTRFVVTQSGVEPLLRTSKALVLPLDDCVI